MMKRPAVRRKTDDLPVRVMAERFSNFQSFGRTERFSKNDGIPQQNVKFKQSKFGNRNIIPRRH